jgi:hypothetical protein
MTAALSYWNRPVRVCQTLWCACPHKAAGDDARCPECRMRPIGAERHGATYTTIHGDYWNGEFGTTFVTYPLPPENRGQYMADLDEATFAASRLTIVELRLWLVYAGIDVAGASMTKRSLARRAASRQMSLWWPRMFVTVRDARAMELI